MSLLGTVSISVKNQQGYSYVKRPDSRRAEQLSQCWGNLLSLLSTKEWLCERVGYQFRAFILGMVNLIRKTLVQDIVTALFHK